MAHNVVYLGLSDLCEILTDLNALLEESLCVLSQILFVCLFVYVIVYQIIIANHPLLPIGKAACIS